MYLRTNMKFQHAVITFALLFCINKGCQCEDVDSAVELPLSSVSSPVALPSLDEKYGIIITNGAEELNAEAQWYRKLIVFIYAADPVLNRRLEKLLNYVYRRSGTNIPLMKVPRIPSNLEIYEEYGFFEPGLRAYEKDRYGNVFTFNLMGGNMNWTYQGLTNFIHMVEKGFKRTLRRQLKSGSLVTHPPVLRSAIGEKIMAGMSEMEGLFQRNNYKKAIVFVYSIDPFDNVQLEQALDEAIIKTGTKIPVMKVTRTPSNKSIYGNFGNINPAIAAYYPKKSGGFNVCSISNENHKWSVQELEGFIRAVETDFKRGTYELMEYTEEQSAFPVPQKPEISTSASDPGIAHIIQLAKMSKFKRIFIYITAKDPEENKKLEKLIVKAHTASGTKVPLQKVIRDPRDQIARNLYGETNAGLGAFELRYSNNVKSISFGEHGEKWTVEELTKFFKTHNLQYNYLT